MASEEEITIKIKADTSDFKKGMDEATESAKGFEKATEGKGGKKGFNATMKETSKTTDGVKDKFKGIGKEGKKSGGILGKAFNGVKSGFMELGASSKLATAGAVGIAIAAVGIIGKLAIDIGKKVMQVSGQMAKMYNPAGFEKATNQMNASITKMKTSLGAVLEPVYKAMTAIVGGLADLFNGVLETVLKIYAAFVGFIGLSSTLSRTAEDYSDAMEEATASADAGLSAFDKLNTLDTSGMGDETQAQRIRDIMADTALAADGVRNSIADALNPMKLLSQLFKTLGLESQWNSFISSGEKAWGKIVNLGEKAWGKIVSIGENAWTTIQNVFTNVWNVITSAFDSIANFGANMWKKITEVGGNVWNTLVQSINNIFGDAINNIRNGFLNAFSTISSTFGNVFGNVLGDIWNGIVNTFSNIGNYIAGVFSNVFSGLNFGGIFDSLREGFKNVLNGIIDMWNNSVANIGWEADILGNKVGINTYGLKLPKFATGTVVEPNDPFLAVLGDNTREREIVSPESVMEGVVRKVMTESQGEGGGKTIEVSVVLDGRKIARGMFDYLTGEAKRRGSAQWQQ